MNTTRTSRKSSWIQLNERRAARTAMLLLLLLTVPAVVQGQYYYTIYNGTVIITGYFGPGGAVIIPSMITNLPVTSIGNGAFYNCTSLASLTIPNSVTSIGSAAFEHCASLTNITIGNSVTNIGDFVFDDCTSLTAMTVDALNPAYSSVDGVLFNKSQTMLVVYPGGKAGSYTIPNSVTSIGYEAFVHCRLTSVTIPNSVTSIGYEAFASCGLTSVTIPNSVTSIGDYTFESCASLTNVTIVDGVTSIGPGAFQACPSLTCVTIPSSVTNVGNGAFNNCTSLTSITIPSGVTSIGEEAFSACTSLTAITADTNNPAYSSVDGVLFNKSQTTLVVSPGGKAGSYTIPSSVSNIGDGAFNGCTSLSSVMIPNSVTSIGGDAFANCTSLTSVTIPNSVTNMEGAFVFCSSLTSVTIPNSVTSIATRTFWLCTSLTGVYFQGNAPSFGYDVFLGDNNVTVYYLPGTTGWTSTFGGRPTALWFLPNPLILNNGPSFGLQGNRFGFIISWATNIPVVVEACTNLANPIWSPVGTNTLTGGWSYFSDSRWTNYPARFYRLRSP